MVDKWRQIQKSNFNNWGKLADYLELTEEQRNLILPQSNFPLNLPLRLAEKVQKGNLKDPILVQFLPTVSELNHETGFSEDPLDEHKFQKTTKLLQKYKSRALLITTSACAMHCRYCFRQNYPYENSYKSYQDELRLLEEDSTIQELILSGGDPLSLSNAVLGDLLKRIDEIPHIKRVRFHTRFPIGIPERLDKGFLELMDQTHKQIWFVIHVNHPKELDKDIFASLKLLAQKGIPLLSQTVLLAGVNDSLESLKLLFTTLVDNGIQPYYLHQLDRVEGTAHFDVEKSIGTKLVQSLREELSGYAIPQYVQEVAGQAYKVPLNY